MSFDEFQRELEALQPLLDRFRQLFVEVEKLILNRSGQVVPHRLFHYTSAQGLEGILSTSSLWATDCRFLNDSHELKGGLAVIADHLSKNQAESFSGVSQFLVSHGMMLAELSSPCVVSFCAESDLLSQWRAYGAEATGYCLELDCSDSRLAACDGATVLIGFLLPVIYEDSTKRAIVDQIVARIAEELAAYGLGPEGLHGLSEMSGGIAKGLIYSLFTLPMLSFKHKGFSEEREWRAVFYPNSVQTEQLRRFRGGSGIFVPYLEAIFLQGDAERLFQRSQFPLASVCLPPAAGETAKLGLEMYLRSRGFRVGKEDGAVQVKTSSIPLRGRGGIHW